MAGKILIQNSFVTSTRTKLGFFFLSYAFTSVHINVWYSNRLIYCWVEKCIWHFLIYTFILCNFPAMGCFPVIMDRVCLRWSLDPTIPPVPYFSRLAATAFVLSTSVKLFPVSSNLAPTCTKYKFHFPATSFQKLIFSFYSFCFPIYHKNILSYKKKALKTEIYQKHTVIFREFMTPCLGHNWSCTQCHDRAV